MITLFEQEILSQGSVLRERATQGRQQAEQAASLWRGKITHAVVAARGSSDNAALFFQYLAGTELGLLVALATPSLFRPPCALRLDGAGVLAISQSGQSPDIVQVLRHASSVERPRIALTNDADSPLAHEAQAVIELHAGVEQAVAATKTFSATWQALAQLVAALKEGSLDGLSELPDLLDVVASWALGLQTPEQLVTLSQGLTVVGRGVGSAAASEISLKIREVAGVRSESYAAPDILHGPIGAEGRGAALLLVLTEEVTDDDAVNLLQRAKDSGMATLLLRSASRRSLNADDEIVVPVSTSNWAFGLATVIVGQVIALRLGEFHHRPIDQPPGLLKVTRTS